MVLLDALKFVQIIISIALVSLIILQARGLGLGSLIGGPSGGAVAKTRRGLEKTLFQMTIILAAAFVLNAILQLLLDN